MAMIDRIFPKPLSYGTAGGPQGLTRIIPGADGRDSRVAKLSRPQRRYDASAAVRSYEDLAAIRKFFYAMNAAEQAFLLDDPIAMSTAEDERSDPSMLDVVLPRVADTQYQLLLRYQSGTEEVLIPIEWPVEDSVLVAIDGVSTSSFTVDTTGGTGIVTIPSLSGDDTSVVTAGCTYRVPVRFSDDEWLSVSADDFSNGSLSSIPLVEVINEPLVPGLWAPGGVEVRSISGNLTVTPTVAFTWMITATESSLDVNMPTPDGFGEGRICTIINAGTTAFTVKGNTGTTLASLSQDDAVEVHHESSYGYFTIGN